MARGQMMFLLVVVLVLLLPPISLSQSAQAGRARCRNKGGDCVADSEVIRADKEIRRSGDQEAGQLILILYSQDRSLLYRNNPEYKQEKWCHRKKKIRCFVKIFTPVFWG